MRCAIMQPTYMPWAGYLNLINQVDIFIFLDDAQYERSSWQNRNRVLINGTSAWLTIPAIRGHLGASINEVVCNDQHLWREKHKALLSCAYARHSNKDAMLQAIVPLDDLTLNNLADLNIAILMGMMSKLNIHTKILRSSTLNISGRRTNRLIDILNEIGATEYLTPVGAIDYLQKDKFTEHCQIKLLVHDFQPHCYEQRGINNFISHLSILDVLANVGWAATSEYITPSSKSIYTIENYI